MLSDESFWTLYPWALVCCSRALWVRGGFDSWAVWWWTRCPQHLGQQRTFFKTDIVQLLPELTQVIWRLPGWFEALLLPLEIPVSYRIFFHPGYSVWQGPWGAFTTVVSSANWRTIEFEVLDNFVYLISDGSPGLRCKVSSRWGRVSGPFFFHLFCPCASRIAAEFFNTTFRVTVSCA